MHFGLRFLGTRCWMLDASHRMGLVPRGLVDNSAPSASLRPQAPGPNWEGGRIEHPVLSIGRVGGLPNSEFLIPHSQFLIQRSITLEAIDEVPHRSLKLGLKPLVYEATDILLAVVLD